MVQIYSQKANLEKEKGIQKKIHFQKRLINIALETRTGIIILKAE